MPYSGLGNRLLDKLPSTDSQWLAGQMDLVRMPVGAVICEARQTPTFACFPRSGVISAVVILAEGATVEVATVGNEGMAGVSALLMAAVSPYRLVQQVEGETYRIRADVFARAVREMESLRTLMDRYILSVFQRVAQNVACHARHTVEERMCRWLLETSERVGSDEFEITQETLGQMLGVRRQSVNLTARLLQEAGLITYQRGRLAILDRTRLERASCECYRVTNEIYAGLLGP